MRRFVLLAVVAVGVGGVAASPTPQEPPTKVIVAGLSNPSEKVRDESAAALKNRVDVLPWLRRAARSADKGTARRAADLLAPHEKKRQEAVAKAIDACLRDGCLDLLTEWHQYWKPEKEDDLWSVGPRAVKPGMDLLAKTCRPAVWKRFQEDLAELDANIDPKHHRFHDGPCPARFEVIDGFWHIRTDRLYPPNRIRFASAERASLGATSGGHFLVLGRVGASSLDYAFLACDGPVQHGSYPPKLDRPTFELGVSMAMSVIVCRGNITGAHIVRDSVLLVDGDIDLTRSQPRNCLIRATGDIRLPKGFSPENCTIAANAKNATAPYKFFELADVGLSLADDEEGLVVIGVKESTPFGNCGIAKGDLIRAIDDVDAGHSEQFRKKLRRAMVRQGDCLVTVARGDKTIDLPVFFPLPK